MIKAKLLKVFSEDECNAIVDSATVVTETCIIISTEDNFFELSGGEGNRVNIYCNSSKNNIDNQITKDAFLKLFKNSPLMEMQHINVDN